MRRLTLLLCAVAALLSAGCGSYRAGPPSALPFSTLHVTLVEDRSFTPQVRALLTSQIIEELNRSGRVQVVSDPSAAEARLKVTLASVERDTTVTQADDSGRSLKVERSYTATLRLEDAKGTRLWLDDAPVTAERFILLLPVQGMANAEQAELTSATRSLAEATARAALGVW